ncbi:MAG: hypothetical protein LBE13_18995 [Bacteroidales bacterium]|jgi:hypothetical protein|nr:hypothetical protein [Bacteroidales bacterium]
MKLKFVLTKIFICCLSLLFVSVQAQGVYNNDASGSDGSGSSSVPGLRGGPPSGGGGPGGPNAGGDQEGEPGDDSDPMLPVGEGLLILTFLAGSYAVVKKKQKTK